MTMTDETDETILHTPPRRRALVRVALLVVVLFVVLAGGLVFAVLRQQAIPARITIDTAQVTSTGVTLPAGLIDPAVADALTPCSDEVYMIHKMVSSRRVAWWEDFWFRNTRNCRDFRLVEYTQPAPDRRCLVVRYSYRFFHTWSDADILVEATREGSQWSAALKSAWIQPPGEQCP